MKKYLVLLIIPLLLFSTGCDDDDSDNDNTIHVSEYPESILGNWKLESIENITETHNVEIDPVYGTETSTTTQNDITSISPFNSTFSFPNPEVRIFTFEYDGDSHFNILFGNTYDEGCIITSYFYNINQDDITFNDMNGNLLWSDHIEYLSNTDLQTKSESSDTSEIINNSYVITRNIIQYNYTRYNSELNLSSCFDFD